MRRSNFPSFHFPSVRKKKNTGQSFSIKSKTTCKNSAHLDDILKKWPKSSLTIVLHINPSIGNQSKANQIKFKLL